MTITQISSVFFDVDRRDAAIYGGKMQRYELLGEAVGDECFNEEDRKELEALKRELLERGLLT